MSQVVFVAGLPGSGKTEYLIDLAQELAAERLDDFKNDAIDHNPNFNYSRHFATLIDGLNGGGAFVVSDIDFCVRESQEQATFFVRALAPAAQIDWRYFANDPEQCRSNVERRAQNQPGRDLARELERIADYTTRYFIPQGAFTIRVWRPTEDP